MSKLNEWGHTPLHRHDMNNDFNNLLKELRPEVPPISDARWRRILIQKDIKIFISQEKGKIIGMAILRWHDLPAGRAGTIEDVIVLKEFRGKGHGQGLMKQIISFAKRKKMTYIDLTSRPERIAANKLYQKMGWEKRETNVYRLML